MELFMELEYVLNNQDLLNFNIYHLNNSPTIKKQIFMARFGVALFYIVIGAFLSYIEKGFTSFIVFSFLSIPWIVFYKKYFMYKAKKQVKRTLHEDKNKGMIGKQKIIIEANKITEINEYSKIEHSNKCLNKISNDPNYYYLYLTSISAIIIPKLVFNDEEIESNFVRLLNQFLE